MGWAHRANKLEDSIAEAKAAVHDRYKSIGYIVDRLEPAVISMMYKEYKGPSTFYPNVGLFFNEFALIYAVNSNAKKTAE